MRQITILVGLVLFPFLFALGARFAPSPRVRSAFVLAAAVLTSLWGLGVACHGTGAGYISLPSSASTVALILELALGGFVLQVAWRLRAPAIGAAAATQLLLVLGEEFGPLHRGFDSFPAFYLDPLSLILALIVSLVGSLILLFALGYMEAHEHHAPPTARSTGTFFFFLVGFLGAMNGLVLANELRWFSFFWECTTLCSFFLIGHDGTEIARANAKRALFLNLLGGIALSGGSLWAAADGGATTLQGLMATKAAVPALLLCMAALVKSAQMPFQSWLLGAMVAPTPVSALLHSATMVKAGSYLLLRLSPAFAGEPFMRWLALGGALTFVLTAALAIGQSNAKRVLAYSTISNLGLIVVCAALGTPMAYAAGLTLLIFHAVSKGLLFLCVGTIEQGIGSRDIEDMGDLVNRMPYTTLFASVGMISMLLPPFGMLLSKWIVVEASIVSPPIMALTVLGSALSVVFWAKWIGRIQTTSTTEHHGGEHLPRTVVAANGLLALAVFGGGLAAVPLLQHCFVPLTEELFSEAPVSPEAWGRLAALGDFELWPLLVCLGGALAAWLLVRRRFSVAQVRAPFLCGENVDSEDPDVTYAFRSVGDLPQEAWSRTLYFRGVFDEERLSFWGNLAAAMILFILAGLTGLI